MALVSLPRQAVNLYESNNCWTEAFRRMISPDFVNVYLLTGWGTEIEGENIHTHFIKKGKWLKTNEEVTNSQFLVMFP